MKKLKRRFLALCLAGMLCALPQAGHAESSEGPKPVIPPSKAPPLPVVEKPAEVKSTFPELPPSRPCTDADVHGLFHLANVYEDPQGTETTSFRASPNQYIMFRSNNLYARVNVEQSGVTTQEVIKQLRQHSTGLLQYLIQNNGFIYFYQNSVAVDVQACFVVAVDKVPFKTGQFLFMPPKGQITGHLVKVYEATFSGKGANRGDADEAPAADNGKGGGKKRRKKSE